MTYTQSQLDAMALRTSQLDYCGELGISTKTFRRQLRRLGLRWPSNIVKQRRGVVVSTRTSFLGTTRIRRAPAVIVDAADVSSQAHQPRVVEG